MQQLKSSCLRVFLSSFQRTVVGVLKTPFKKAFDFDTSGSVMAVHQGLLGVTRNALVNIFTPETKSSIQSWEQKASKNPTFKSWSAPALTFTSVFFQAFIISEKNKWSWTLFSMHYLLSIILGPVSPSERVKAQAKWSYIAKVFLNFLVPIFFRVSRRVN